MSNTCKNPISEKRHSGAGWCFATDWHCRKR